MFHVSFWELSELTSAVLSTDKIDVYASKNTFFALFTISSPRTLMSLASPNPKPIKYSIFAANKIKTSNCISDVQRFIPLVPVSLLQTTAVNRVEVL